jgi:hypothetical protein
MFTPLQEISQESVVDVKTKSVNFMQDRFAKHD